MSETTELVITGTAKAEVMERIRLAHDKNHVQELSEIFAKTSFDAAVCASVEVIANAVFTNQKISSIEEKCDYVCSAAALMIAYTSELIKQMLDAADGKA